MKDAKYKHKLAVRDAIRSYESRFSDELFDHLLSKDMQRFWRAWSSKTCKNVLSVGSIDGLNDNVDIADVFNVFRDRFSACSVSADSTQDELITTHDDSFLPSVLSVETVCDVCEGRKAGVPNLMMF